MQSSGIGNDDDAFAAAAVAAATTTTTSVERSLAGSRLIQYMKCAAAAQPPSSRGEVHYVYSSLYQFHFSCRFNFADRIATANQIVDMGIVVGSWHFAEHFFESNVCTIASAKSGKYWYRFSKCGWRTICAGTLTLFYIYFLFFLQESVRGTTYFFHPSSIPSHEQSQQQLPIGGGQQMCAARPNSAVRF